MRHALIVDDNDENLQYLEALFSGHGHQVTTARHGAEALAKAREAPPDIVVSDLLMPVMDGYTLLRHWKADNRLRNVPFVVYTATYTESEDEELARNLGADEFILKPCGPIDFMARIDGLGKAQAVPEPEPAVPDGSEQENGLLQLYNKTLIRKLEQKSLELEDANRLLQEDIAERHKAEALLRLLTSAVMQSKESILLTDAQLDPPGPRIVFANPAFTRLTGHDVKDVIGKTPRILQGPRTDRALLDRLRACLEKGEDLEGAATQYRKDGSEYEQEWHIAPIRDGEDVITHFVAIQRDVTERKRSEEALRASESAQRRLASELEAKHAHLLAAQRVAKIGDWETDLATMEVTWSEETYRIHEADPAVFRPTHPAFLELVHPEDRERVAKAFIDSLDRAVDDVIEHRLLLPGGVVKYVEERWTVAADEHGNAVRAIGTCQDITDRKLVEIRSIESRDRLSLATQSAQIGIWDWDIASDVLTWDARMCELYGIDATVLSGAFRAWQDTLHPEDRVRAEAELLAAIDGTRRFDTEFRVVWPSGEVRDIKSQALVQRD